MNGTTYMNPIYGNNEMPFLPASHVVNDKGTGLVHTAPAHGFDDYLVCLERKMPIVSRYVYNKNLRGVSTEQVLTATHFQKCLVDENGHYTAEAGTKLQNLFVLSEGTRVVLDILQNDIVHTEHIVHSYPYDWRTKKPVILRASKQWFVDTNSITKKAEVSSCRSSVRNFYNF